MRGGIDPVMTDLLLAAATMARAGVPYPLWTAVECLGYRHSITAIHALLEVRAINPSALRETGPASADVYVEAAVRVYTGRGARL